MAYQFGIATQQEQYGVWVDPYADRDAFGDRRLARAARTQLPDPESLNELLRPRGIQSSVETGSAYYEPYSFNDEDPYYASRYFADLAEGMPGLDGSGLADTNAADLPGWSSESVKGQSPPTTHIQDPTIPALPGQGMSF